jgi:Mg-chelatase subunit ChlD
VLRGIPIEGNSVLYIVDASGSMASQPEFLLPRSNQALDTVKRAVTRHAGTKVQTAMDTLRALLPKREPRRATPSTKLGIAKQELLESIDSLPQTTRFSVIVFAETATAWQATAAQATSTSKQSVRSFVAAVEAGGATNLGKALDIAFAMRDIEHIVLVTDGSPTDRGTAQILAQVREHARKQPTRITTVGLGPDQNVQLLGDIAQLTGARYYRR